MSHFTCNHGLNIEGQ